MASVNDKFIKTIIAPPTKLTGAITDKSTVLTVESTVGWSSDTAIIAVIDRVNSQGEETPEKMEVVIGTMSSNGLEGMLRGVGGKAQSHGTGAVVELGIAGSEQWNRAMSALIEALGQDGRSIDGARLKTNSLDGSKIKSGSIEATKIKSGVIPFTETSPATHNLAVGYGYSVTLTKFGKLVFVSSTGIANVAGTGSRGERIPEGWRPAHNTPLIGIAVNNTNFTGAFSLILGSDGSIQWQGARGHNEYHISAVYFLA